MEIIPGFKNSFTTKMTQHTALSNFTIPGIFIIHFPLSNDLVSMEAIAIIWHGILPRAFFLQMRDFLSSFVFLSLFFLGGGGGGGDWFVIFIGIFRGV